LSEGLRSRGIDVVTAADARMIRRKDEDRLSWATADNRALYSFSVGDFHQIHTEWTTGGRNHCGIVLSQQKRFPVGEQIRRLLRLIGGLTAEAIHVRCVRGFPQNPSPKTSASFRQFFGIPKEVTGRAPRSVSFVPSISPISHSPAHWTATPPSPLARLFDPPLSPIRPHKSPIRYLILTRKYRLANVVSDQRFTRIRL